MSFVEFSQSVNQLRGICAFEADPSWELEAPSEQESLIAPKLKTAEGNGSWLVFDRDHLTWGSVVRADDSPYNDCLPASESLLLSAFADHQEPAPIVSELKRQTGKSFFNPFRAVVGSLETEGLIEFFGSFQPGSTKHDSGLYRLRDNAPLKSLDIPQVLPDPNKTSFLEEARKTISSGEFKDLNGELLANDGLRDLAILLAFEWNPEALRFAYCDVPSRDNRVPIMEFNPN